MIIPFKTFTGEYPRTATHLLPDHAAQYALNCDFLSGSLKGIRLNKAVPGLTNLSSAIRSLFVYDTSTWASTYFWDHDVDAVRSPVVNDAYNRFYWANGANFYVSRADIGGGGAPSTVNRYWVGVPTPQEAPWPQSVKLVLPDVASVVIKVEDEHEDGTISNEGDPTNLNVEYFDKSIVYTFNARAPAEYGASAAPAAPTSSVVATGTWYLTDIKATMPNGYVLPAYADAAKGYVLPAYVDAAYGTRGAIVYYYKDLIGVQPGVIDIDVDGSATQVVQLNGTYWYGNPGTTPPSNASPATDAADTVTAVTAAVKNPLVIMNFIKSDGSLVTAKIRPDSNETTWPLDFPGISAAVQVSETGTIWNVVLTAREDYVESRAYAYTFVNAYGEEGAPSGPTILDCFEHAEVKLTYSWPTDNYVPVQKVRFYRAGAGASSEYLYVGEASFSSDRVFTDTTRNEALGHTLDTHNYYPPAQDLKGVCVMANGMLAGFRENEVHFSEPYLPYAWNPSAIKPIPNKVVGICPFEGGLYVTTTAEPYIIQGAAPEYMTDMRVPSVQAGVSKGSITNYNGQVVYASNDGLVMLQGTQVSLDMSFRFFSRSDWQSRFGDHLSHMRLNVHDGSLLVWFDNGQPGFLIRFEEESPSLTELSYGLSAAFQHPTADALYIGYGNSAYEFRGGISRVGYIWHSKEFVVPKPTNFGALQITGSGTIGEVHVYADADLVHISTAVDLGISGRGVLRLPSGFLARRWSVYVNTFDDCDIHEMYLATSMTELQNV